MNLRWAVGTLALVLFFIAFYVWFVDSEKRHDTASNLWRDVQQSDRTNGVMLGSSTIRKFDADRLLTCGQWENRGIGTAGIPNILNYLKLTRKSRSPKWVLVYGGDNDVARDGATDSETNKMYAELNDTLLSLYPETTLLLLEIKPSPKRAVHHSTYENINTKLAEFAEENDQIKYVSIGWDNIVNKQGQDVFQTDGVHLNELGNQIMANGINEQCNKQ